MFRRRTPAEPPAPEAAPEAPDVGEGRPRYRTLYLLWAVVVVAVAGGVLLVLVLPTRAWLDQRAEVHAAERKLAVMQQANADLEAKIAALQTPAEIERVAREQFSLVKPGEQVYSVLPASAPDGLPSGWPFDLVGQIVATRNGLPATTPATATASQG